MTSSLAVVVAAAVVGALGGLLVPRLVAALPEPARDSADGDGKTTYVDLAARPGLSLASAGAAALACGLAAVAVGWSPALPMWVYLGVVGVALGYVDWCTRLLPTRLIAPSYAVVGVCAVLASALTGDWSALLGALFGWVLAGGLYFLLWFVYPRGMGYGDVRLSGVLGIALGWLGMAELVLGIYAGFLLGAVVGGGLALAKVVDRRRYAFGPFMLAGALVGALWGETAARWYGGG
ncbi:MAG TPA: A24 family peptidase [Nocardioidaceae bacterium]|nr:A24 family peptidase [Nocardioidaceae bacterium]